ncbi:MAG: tetratricopeptide repeat protein [Desulfobacca sp.]|nr:tetratricopeptide repeat protein [Desulfobacca sp.]
MSIRVPYISFHQAGVRVIVIPLIIMLLSNLTIKTGKAGGPPGASVVTVVSLDSQGQPLRQGLGVIVEPENLLLSSLEVFLNSGGGVMVTPQETLRLIKGVVYQDRLQDLALLKVEAEGLQPAVIKMPPHIKIAERLWLPVRKDSGIIFKEVKVKGLHTISPRLKLLELEAAEAAGASGTPLFNQAGKLVGVGHQIINHSENGEFRCYYLLFNQSSWPPTEKISEEPLSFPNILEPTSRNSAERCFWQGIAALVAKDWSRADKQFTNALEANPQFPEAYYGRAQTRFFLKDFSGAEKDLNQALKCLPDYDRAYFWLGKTLQKLDRQAEAVMAYEMAVKINPNFPEAHFQLGQLAYQQKEWDRAATFFNQAREGFPQAARTWWYLGTIAQSRHHTAAAITSFKEAIALNPQFFEAYLELGKLLLLDRGQPQEAVKFLSQGVEQRPQNGEARLYLALAQLVIRDRGGALEQYLTLQDLNPRLAARLNQVMQQVR